VSFLQIVPGVFPAGVVTGVFCAFSAENQRGDRKTQTHRPSYTKQPTLKKICANLRHLRIKNVCYQSLIARARRKRSPIDNWLVQGTLRPMERIAAALGRGHTTHKACSHGLDNRDALDRVE
jgi:hypothetical protein